MAKEIYGMDVYWLNFFGLMVLTVIEVAAVGEAPSGGETGRGEGQSEFIKVLAEMADGGRRELRRRDPVSRVDQNASGSGHGGPFQRRFQPAAKDRQSDATTEAVHGGQVSLKQRIVEGLNRIGTTRSRCRDAPAHRR